MGASEEKAVYFIVNRKWKEKSQLGPDITFKSITPVVHIPQQDPTSKSCHNRPNITTSIQPMSLIRDILYSNISQGIQMK